MEENLPKVTDLVSSRDVVISSCLKVNFKFWKMYLEMQQEELYLTDIF